MKWLDKFIVSERGQWDYPGYPTAVPTKNGRITMEGVPYPVIGFVPGEPPVMMHPGENHKFPGKMVYEIPVKKGGGHIVPGRYRNPEGNWLNKYQDGSEVAADATAVKVNPLVRAINIDKPLSNFDYQDYYDKANKYLSRDIFKGTTLTAKDIADAANEFYTESNYQYPLDLLLTQAQIESKLGKQLKSKHNYFNVGNTDSGATRDFASAKDSVRDYINLMYNDYLNKGQKSVDELLKPKGFVNHQGNRYASNPDYENMLSSQMQFINNYLKDYKNGGWLNQYEKGGTVSQIWEETTGLPWSEAKKRGYTTGTKDENINLLNQLKSGSITINKEPTSLKALGTSVDISNINSAPSFNAAFQIARQALGPNKIFEYQGRKYGTNLAGEQFKPSSEELAAHNLNKQEIKKSVSDQNKLVSSIYSDKETVKLEPEYQDWDNIKKRQDELNKSNQADIIINYHKDKKDQYVIVDKAKGKMHLYVGSKPIATYNVGTGENAGDEQTYTVIRDGKVHWDEGNKMTGAGIYTVSGSQSKNPHYSNAPTWNFINDKGIEVPMAMHSSFGDRTSKIKDSNTENNRLSNGCINGLCYNLKDLYAHGFNEGDKLYILPDDPNNKFEISSNKLIFKSKDPKVNRTEKTLVYNPISIKLNTEAFKNNVFTALDFNDEEELKTTNAFIKSLENNKRAVMKAAKINGDVYNELAKMAFGIYGTESNYGDTHSGIGNFVRAVNKVMDKQSSSSPDYNSKYTTYGASEDFRSVGLTQIRFNMLDAPEKKILKELGITTNDQLLNPEDAAKATVAILASRYANQLDDEEKKDVWKNLPKTWNTRDNYSERVLNNSRYVTLYQKNINSSQSKQPLVLKKQESAYSQNNNYNELPYANTLKTLGIYKTGGSVKWLNKYQGDTEGSQVKTYASDPAYFDNRAIYHDDSRFNDLIRSKVYAGTHGWDPTTNSLVKLDKPVAVPKAVQEMSTADYGKKTSKERFESKTPAGKATRKAVAAQGMKDMVQNPAFYVPGAIAAAALAGPAISGAIGTGLSTPLQIGSTTIPGVTLGNAINLGFGLHGANMLASDIDTGYYSSDAPAVDKITRGLQTGLDITFSPGLIEGMGATLNQGAKLFNRGVQLGKNELMGQYMSRMLDKTKLPAYEEKQILGARIDPINKSSVNVRNDLFQQYGEEQYNDILDALYKNYRGMYDMPLVEFKSSRPSSFYSDVGASMDTAEGMLFKEKFCLPGSECAKTSNAVTNKVFNEITGTPFAVEENAHNAWHLEDQMTRHGGKNVTEELAQGLPPRVGDRILMGNNVDQSTYVPGYTADPNVRHAGFFAGYYPTGQGDLIPMILESGANNPLYLNPMSNTIAGKNSVQQIIRPQQFLGDDFGKALVDKNIRYAFRNKPSVATYSSENEVAQSLLTKGEEHREKIKRMHDLTNDEFDELLNSLIGIGAQETKLNAQLPSGYLSAAKIKLQNTLGDIGLTAPIKKTINIAKRTGNALTSKSSSLPKYPGTSVIEMESAKLADAEGIPFSDALKVVKSQYQPKPKFIPSTVEPSKGMFRQKFKTENARTSDFEYHITNDELGHGLSQMAENYTKIKKLYPDATPRQLIDLTTLMWNSPGKAQNKQLVDFYLLGKGNPNPSKFSFDYLNKVNKYKDQLINVHPQSVEPYKEVFRAGYPEIQYKHGGSTKWLDKYEKGGVNSQGMGYFDYINGYEGVSS